MYNNQLSEISVSINNIFLDPNNPRFWSEQIRDISVISDQRIIEENNQKRALEEISKYGIDELKNSILRNGFLPLDRIVVRELSGAEGNYVVIEGNRRLAALVTLRRGIEQGTILEEGIEEEQLEQIHESTNSLKVLLYEGDETSNISWILQGIRHISGIRDWAPAQQGKLVADQIEREGLSFTEAGQRFGLSAQKVGKRYRSYKALEQMRSDPEFRAKAENKYYSLFEEAIGQKKVKEWLGWDSSENKFTAEENLRQFYEWIIPDEEHEDNARRIHDPRHIKALGAILDSGKAGLISQIHNHEIEIEAAYQKVKDIQGRFDWNSALETATTLLSEIPGSCIAENRQEILHALLDLRSKIQNLIELADNHEETAATEDNQI